MPCSLGVTERALPAASSIAFRATIACTAGRNAGRTASGRRADDTRGERHHLAIGPPGSEIVSFRRPGVLIAGSTARHLLFGCTPASSSSWPPSCSHMPNTSSTMHRCAAFKAAGIAQRPQNLQQRRAVAAPPRRTLALASAMAGSQEEEHQPFRRLAAAVTAFGAASALLLGSAAPPASAAGGRLPPITESADR